MSCGLLGGPSFRCSRIMRGGNYGFEKKKNREGRIHDGEGHGSTRAWSASSRRRRYEGLRNLMFIGRRSAQNPQAPSRWMTSCGRGGAQAHRVPTTVGGGGARGNSKTDRYSNVTSLELNYNQAKRMRGDWSLQQGASNLLSTCEIAAAGGWSQGERLSRRAVWTRNWLH